MQESQLQQAMDPGSIIGLSAAIQQLLTCVFKFSQGVREAKREINLLCSELLALKAALDHIQMNLQLNNDAGTASHLGQVLCSPNIGTSEFQGMISLTGTTLNELLSRLDSKPGRLRSTLQRLTWPLVKDEVKLFVDRLERLKSWFVLATTSDNM